MRRANERSRQLRAGDEIPGVVGQAVAVRVAVAQDQRTRESLDRGLAFLSHFMGPGGAFAGPIGVRELTTMKYVVTGDGHVRS